MKYLQLTIKVGQDRLPRIKERLEAAGFDEMIINDPSDFKEIEDHPEWYKYDYINEELAGCSDDYPEITLFFTDDEEGRSSAETAAGILETAEETTLTWELNTTGDDSEWLYRWQEHFKPTKVGERIVVKPSWEEYEAEPGELVIEMDPGMAFGSGLHETTTLCIKALERSFTLHGMRVLDVGCGTGILSIAAAMLGADECLGIDIDPDAVRTAEENIKRNGLSDKVGIVQGDLTDGVEYHPDILVANLMADLVIRLAPAAAEQLSSGGIFISSGILDIKAETVANTVRAAGFSIEDIMRDGEWCAIIARRDTKRC